MSSIGPPSVPGMNLAGSFAGAGRTDANADRAKQASAEQKLATDRQEMSARSLGDVAQADESDDRDADGRLPWEDSPSESTDSETGDDLSTGNRLVPDPDGERGRTLDLEA